VLPALVRKFFEAVQAGAPSVDVWGSGNPMREFLHVDDLAEACVFLMRNYSDAGPVNVGTGTDLSIRDLANLIKTVSGFGGGLSFDPSKPDGTPRKLLDISRITAMGWRPAVTLEAGIRKVWDDVMRGEVTFS